MKKISFIASVIALLLFSCKADQATVDKMADEMCEAMSRYHVEDPKTFYNAAGGMLGVVSNEQEYGRVMESQLNEAMKKRCPEGYRKFIKLSDQKNR